jgi:SH3-like domain-containing protein
LTGATTLLAVLLAASLLLVAPVRAAPDATGLPVPRFVSLRASEANMRTGPGEQYPIKWTYRRSGLPLEITAEYDHWRRVRDWQGTEGWMHVSMLSSRRALIIVGSTRILRTEPAQDSVPAAKLENQVIGKLLRCNKDSDWCRVEVETVSGWLRRGDFWASTRRRWSIRPP